MFLGKYEHALDTKNRLFIPAKLREELGDVFYVSAALIDKCLRVYPIDVWNDLTAHFSSDYMDEKTRVIRRKLFTSSSQNSLDSQGRTIIPDDLRKYASLTKDIYILGVGKYLEIWDKETLDKMYESDEADKEIESILLDIEKNG